MDVVSSCPLRAGSVRWEREPGEWFLTVICKGTVELFQGDSRLSPEHDYINEESNHWNDDANRSLYSPSDIAPFKQRADVLLVGHAFAPRAEPVRSLVVRMIVGAVDKSIEVHADRAWTQDGLLREGGRFVKMPLRYERAAGGADTWNPVGIAPDGRRDVYGNSPLPNLQPPGVLVSDPSDYIEPIGYGPIAPAWPSRRDKLGRYAEVWTDSGWNKQPVPSDFDAAYWNSAPRDQQIDEIRADERIILENLHAKYPRLITRLPGLRPRASVERAGGSSELDLVCDTLWIDTDRSVCTLTWRGRVALSSPTELGHVQITLDGFEGARRKRARTEQFTIVDEPTETTGLVHEQEIRLAGLPFQQSAAPVYIPPAPPKPSSSLDLSATVQRHDPKTDNLHAMGDASPSWLASARPQAQAQQAVALAPTPVAPVAPPPPEQQPAPIAPALVSSPWAGAQAGPPSTGANALPWPAPAARSEPAPSVSVSPSPTQPAAQMQSFVSNAAVAAAATGGAVAASDAAAAAARSQIQLNDKAPPEERPPPPKIAPPEAVDLLWFNPKSLKRIKTWWKDVVNDVEFEEIDVRHEIPSDNPDEEKSRRVVFAVLTNAKSEDAAGVSRAVADSVSDKGRFTPPMVLVTGELRFSFDDIETLKATVGVVTPVIGGDKKLKESVDAVNELLKTPYLQGSNGMVQKIGAQLQEQLTQSNRNLPPNYLELNVERLLLEQRSYHKRKVFGEQWLRALLYAGSSDSPIPTYLPEALADTLPLAASLRVRMVAEVFPQQDQYETHAYALRVAALGRLMRIEGWRR